MSDLVDWSRWSQEQFEEGARAIHVDVETFKKRVERIAYQDQFMTIAPPSDEVADLFQKGREKMKNSP